MDRKGTMVELQCGRTPNGNKEILRTLTVGLDKVSSFIRREYFASYITEGGSKIKFLMGKKGSGKTHLLALMSADAEEEGFLSICLDAQSILLSDMTNLYLALYRSIDFEDLSSRIAQSIMRSLGYDYNMEEGKSAMDWLSDRGEQSVMARQELRSEVRRSITSNKELDHNFAQILSLKVSEKLGILTLDEELDSLSDDWLNAEKSVKVAKLRSFGLAGYKINKTNARRMLKSLGEAVHIAGYTGLFVSLDNLQNIVSTSSLEEVKYTKMKRDDAYEVIRQLIDDIDVFRYFFLILSFDRILVDHEKWGMKSYQALWLRVQNEIVSGRVNLYNDLLDLDNINPEILVPQSVMEMSHRLTELFRSENFSAHEVTREEAEAILKESKFGSVSIPLLTNKYTLQVKEA